MCNFSAKALSRFLASQYAQEVVLVSEETLTLTWLMWLWSVMIPLEDFTDDHDDCDEDEDEDEHEHEHKEYEN